MAKPTSDLWKALERAGWKVFDDASSSLPGELIEQAVWTGHVDDPDGNKFEIVLIPAKKARS